MTVRKGPYLKTRSRVLRSFVLLAIGCFTLAHVPVNAGEPIKPPALKNFIEKLDEPIVLRGDYFKAVLTAYQRDFANEILKEKAKKAETLGGREGEFPLLDFLSKIENYDIAVELKDGNYIVNFGPTLREGAPEIFGGGAHYIIEERTFKIIEKQYTK